jgi:hypothetical protein
MKYEVKITDITSETIYVEASNEKVAKWLAQGEFKDRLSKGRYDDRGNVIRTDRKIEVKGG